MTTGTRRDALKLLGGAALAAPFVGAGQAFAAREKELNILCWEGYNSAQVLDPFRSSRSATVKAESLTNDPTMINRLRAGETKVWDLINVNNPWARKAMYPEGLIKPLPREEFAVLCEDAARIQGALPLGDERRRQGAARHGPALRALQLRRQHRQG
jgi:spermidine/putrescine transport system substrate-binding protein